MIPNGFWSNRPGLWRWGVGLICYSIIVAIGYLIEYFIFRNYSLNTMAIVIFSISLSAGVGFIALTAGKTRRRLPPGKIGLWDHRTPFWKIGLVLFILSVYITFCNIIENEYYFTLQFSSHGFLGILLMLQGERKRVGSLSDVLKIKTSIWWITLLSVALQIVFNIFGFAYLQSLNDFLKILTYNERGIVGLIIVILCIYNSKRRTAF